MQYETIDMKTKEKTCLSCCCFRKTRFGPVAIIWSLHGSRPMISRILLSKPGLPATQIVKTMPCDQINSSSAEIDTIADQIEAFLAGQDIRFSLDITRLDLCPTFQRKTLRAEHGIPRGYVSTYRRIAIHLGNPRGARPVGNALAGNPFPIIIPCHRAIRSDGTLGGFQGGIEMKRALLEMEGVTFDIKGNVVSEMIFY